ncbi:hypothetical protein KIN20_016439 [Parelaphostrongylus tenuis]|uniref:Uncharacterized protein n=1 Tax=Parelaphostrongylus tenuis TaxID=148309 RepID=A0AAD5MGH4_PARTN|nr:hypothetical protein KIN20_016439 [Parelaphostrongylus tenuis]
MESRETPMSAERPQDYRETILAKVKRRKLKQGRTSRKVQKSGRRCTAASNIDETSMLKTERDNYIDGLPKAITPPVKENNDGAAKARSPVKELPEKISKPPSTDNCLIWAQNLLHQVVRIFFLFPCSVCDHVVFVLRRLLDICLLAAGFCKSAEQNENMKDET